MVGEVKYGSLPFKEQIAYFRNKANVPTERWADLWKEAHNRGFMVAGAMQEDLLADFRKAVDAAISEGKSLNWFKSQFKQIVAKHGWEHNGAASWRSQVIYETNLRQSYTAGREQQIEQVKARRPYGIYKHSGSEHPRHDHLFWNNLVLPLDDPWWQTHTPINGYGCKCKKLTASQRTLDRLGLKVSQAPNIEHYDWVDKVTGEVHSIPKGIDPGFDYTPKSSTELTQKAKAVIDAKPPLAERLPTRVVDHAFSTVKGVDAQSLSAVLAQLASPQVALFSESLKKHDLKTLFIKQTEMSGKAKSREIANDVESYLQSGERMPVINYITRNYVNVGGFTSQRWQHVVVKVKSTDRLAKVNAMDIQNAIADVIEKETATFTFSSAVERAIDSNAKVITTWAHEMGHQIHYKAGLPTPPKGACLTRYGETNEKEWFAEHFVAWLFSPDALQKKYPEIFNFVTDTVNNSI
jgi:hypothetical protein